MAGGAKGSLGNALIRTGIGFGGEAPRPASTGAQYTPVTPNVYNPAFSSVQNPTNSGMFGSGGESVPVGLGSIGMGTGTTVGVQQGLPMAAGFGGGFMTPQAAPQQPSTVGIGPPADLRAIPQQTPQTVQQTIRPMAPPNVLQRAGLQALMANMMAQYQNVPGALAMTQRPQMQAPRFSAPALAYRPNIQAVQQNLSRVKPSVYKTDLDNARARIAELEQALGRSPNMP